MKKVFSWRSVFGQFLPLLEIGGHNESINGQELKVLKVIRFNKRF
jgi:hypothetical protein